MSIRTISGLLCMAVCAGPLAAQTRKGPTPQAPKDVLRAVSVYEWTGDLAKPAAARMVPVSLFIDHQFQDAGVYLSRPMPMALEPGTIYSLETAGVNKGALTLINAGRVRSTPAASRFDVGWFGYGTWKPPAAPKPYVPGSMASNAHIVTSGETRPHFGRTPETAPTPPAASSPAPATPSKTDNAPPTDPDRPTLHHTAPGDPQRTSAPDTSSKTMEKSPPAAAPSTPVTPAAAPASTPTPASTPAPATPPATQSKPSDPSSTGADRPTFPRQPPTDKKKKPASASASVTDAGGLLGEDTGRPHLHHGGATSAAALPALHGLPPDMHQAVAVSDAVDRPEHEFAYAWADGNEKALMMAKLETLARAALAPAALPVKPMRTAPVSARKHKTPSSPPVELLDEELHGYEISYGGATVFVFMAHVGNEDTGVRYVTLLAQPDIYGTLHLLLQSVTDAKHMDQTPWMRFIDAVDADGDNRAELLFELRGETQRQFALYRIAQGTVTQEFATGAQ